MAIENYKPVFTGQEPVDANLRSLQKIILKLNTEIRALELRIKQLEDN